jgi:superfamily I DNA/RNA helicase
MTAEEMKSEVENFIFANGTTEDEYLREMVPRTGMRKRLTREQRGEVWECTEEFVREMETTGIFTKNYGRLRLLQYLREGRGGSGIRDISYLFLDEVQDLTPTALMVLRECTRSVMVMAGDTDQSLYNYQPPFARAGINLRGTTKVLKTNFRNTVQIHALAEDFRRRCPQEEWENYSRPLPFREGPDPELYTADSPENCLGQLSEKLQIFLDDIGYEPENICILVPRNRHFDEVCGHFDSEGIRTAVITGRDFEFTERGSVRVSTLHSSKGLDFPVVLMYLPALHRRPQYGDAEVERLLRNLLYVGLTRAMDNLNVFAVKPDPPDPVLEDLIAAFRTA